MARLWVGFVGVWMIGSVLPAEEPKPLFDIQASLNADAGDYVLCPSRAFYEKALSDGADKTTFIYYAATLVEPGRSSSKVRNLAGQEFTLPNQLIVPIHRDQTAAIGDILLSWWQTGSGMQRCIVVGGTPSEPVVRYLDIDFENPSGAGKQEGQLKAGTFHVLSQPWQLGTTVSVQAGSQQRTGQLLAIDEDSVLVKEFAGRLKVYPRQKTRPLPLYPKLASGDSALASLFGSLKKVKVQRVEKDIGRVFATYQFGGKEKEKAFSFGHIKAVED